MAANPSIGKKKKVVTRPCERCATPFDVERTQCPNCRQNNIEAQFSIHDDGTVLLSDASVQTITRIPTGEWDECWGSHIEDDGTKHTGIVTTSVTLLGGAPGAGKSTLALMLAVRIAKRTGREVLYVSGEEGNDQIRARHKRLGLTHIHLIRMAVAGRVKDLSACIGHRKPVAIIVDSIPTICPDMADAVEFAGIIKSWSTKLESPVILIDHVTKEEEFAGLQALQHIVDTTLLFTVYDDGIRELRSIKNRNGASGVKRFFTMETNGLIHTTLDDENDDEDEDDDDESQD